MKDQPQTADSLIALYDRLYALQGKKQHPRKRRGGVPVMIGRYGESIIRNPTFIRFIKEHVPIGSSIHDAGCGRGYILAELLRIGYDATGSDCAASLFYQELKDLPAKMIAYADLQVLGFESFDAVVSNDVLEHLVDEDAVENGIENLVSITKDWLLVSVGTRPVRNYPVTHDLEVMDLHRVVRGGPWWQKKFSKHVDNVWTHEGRASWFGFGRKRRS